MSKLQRTDVDGLKQILDAQPDATVIDVRTAREFRSAHIDRAVNVPLSSLDARMDELSRDKKIHVICQSGRRSEAAATAMAKAGLRPIQVDGGMAAWRGAGHPVERGAAGFPLLPLGAALTLGLAPFTPEPHIVGKLRWVAGGAEGMTGADWFDLAMHGAPWVWLAVALVGWLRSRKAA